MATFPMFLTEKWTSTGQRLGSVLPWYALSGLAMEGHPDSDPSRKEVKVVFEWPLPHWTVVGGRLPKGEVERLHLQRYNTDRLYIDKELPYANVMPGSNPPDFTAELADGTEVGIDVTQLTVSSRISAQARFERIQAAVLERAGGEFSRLRGHFLYVWFTDPSGDASPHDDPEGIDDVVDALADYVPDTSWAATPMPPPYVKVDPDVQLLSGGCRFYAVQLRDAVPASRFYEATGFELVLAYQSSDTLASPWRELWRLVKKHDKPKIQHLLLTVGGPKANGVAFPSEALIFDAALEKLGHPILEPAPSHLKKVLIHTWWDGRIFEVYPESKAWEPLYKGGYGLSHYALIEKKVPIRFDVGPESGIKPTS